MLGQDQGLGSPKDKSLFYYGGLYNRLFDPLIKHARAAIIDRVAADTSVLDIGCGTGLLCFDLRREKNCRVVGIDLSRKMLDFGRSNNPFDDIEFLHQDATNMKDLHDNSFDYVVVLNVIHELKLDKQLKLLKESLRVGDKVILFDSTGPLPWNVVGVVKRFIEIFFGFDHYPQFRSYTSSGGIDGILDASGLTLNIVDRSIFSRGSYQMVIVSD
jgi:SAM-dependent methyltransferase